MSTPMNQIPEWLNIVLPAVGLAFIALGSYIIYLNKTMKKLRAELVAKVEEKDKEIKELHEHTDALNEEWRKNISQIYVSNTEMLQASMKSNEIIATTLASMTGELQNLKGLIDKMLTHCMSQKEGIG